MSHEAQLGPLTVSNGTNGGQVEGRRFTSLGSVGGVDESELHIRGVEKDTGRRLKRERENTVGRRSDGAANRRAWKGEAYYDGKMDEMARVFGILV